MDKKSSKKSRIPNVIYGYERTSDGKLSVLKNEADVVKSIFEMYAKEGLGTSRIAKSLNNDGITTKHGNPWNQVTVSRIIANDLYTGKVADEDGKATTIKEYAIVDKKLFDKANAKMKEKSSAKTSFKSSKGTYTFSGLIVCKCCSSKFRRLSRTFKNTYVRWVCMARNMNGADYCPNTMAIDEEDLIEVIDEYLGALLESEDDAKGMIEDEYTRIHGKANLDFARSVINENFDAMKSIVNDHKYENKILTKVIDKIVTDEDGNLDIFLKIFDTLEIDNDLFA